MTNILKDIDAVIFDVDGTLVDSMWIWEAVDEDYFVKYNLTRPENFHEDIEGKSYREVAQYYLDHFPELEHTLEELMDEWTEMAHSKYMHEVVLKNGVYELLCKMHEDGKQIGIATSNGKSLVEDMLRALQVDHLFDSVHSACEVKAGKPSPDVYLLVAEDLGVKPEHCLVFEDVPMGILAGKNAGMRVCAVEDTFSRPQEEKKRELADYYIQDYTDILQETYEVL